VPHGAISTDIHSIAKLSTSEEVCALKFCAAAHFCALYPCGSASFANLANISSRLNEPWLLFLVLLILQLTGVLAAIDKFTSERDERKESRWTFPPRFTTTPVALLLLLLLRLRLLRAVCYRRNACRHRVPIS
jgi:hypothetical protein